MDEQELKEIFKPGHLKQFKRFLKDYLDIKQQEEEQVQEQEISQSPKQNKQYNEYKNENEKEK